MNKCFIGLGSNLGGKKENLENAIALLRKQSVVKNISSFYETDPILYLNQPKFLNAVVEIYTHLSPQELLSLVNEIEAELGRKRKIRFGPRTIDLDILFFGDEIIKGPNLTIPHPELHKREFVLKPLAEIAPDFVHPVLKKTVKQLLEGL